MEVTIKSIKDFFGYQDLTQFKSEWAELTEQDKVEIREMLTALNS